MKDGENQRQPKMDAEVTPGESDGPDGQRKRQTLQLVQNYKQVSRLELLRRYHHSGLFI